MNSEDMVDKTLWLLAYDVPSEHIKNLDPDKRHWLNINRRSIWWSLRYKYKCAPVQKSLWLIRGEEQRAELASVVDVWRKEYEAKGFPQVQLEIFPITTNEAGHETFVDWEFEFLLDWASKIYEKLSQYSSSRPPTKRTLTDYKRRLGLIEEILREDFGGYKRYNEANDVLTIIQDNILQLVGFAK